MVLPVKAADLGLTDAKSDFNYYVVSYSRYTSWPIEITPDWVQGIQKLTPTGWTMDALHKLINFRAGAASAIPHVIALFTATWVMGRIASKRFRYA